VTERKRLVKKLDSVFSAYIRARDKSCIVCGSTENLQCGHLFSRTNYSTRWDAGNAAAQCRGCNMRHEYDWEPMRAAYIEIHGQEKYDTIYRRHTRVNKFSNNHLMEYILFYELLLEQMEGGWTTGSHYKCKRT